MAGKGTNANGYGHQHRKVKANWQTRIDRGEYVECHAERCIVAEQGGSRQVTGPSHTWHLGHTPDRTAWTGPEHVVCNTTEGILRRWHGQPPDTDTDPDLEPTPTRRWAL